MAVVTIHRWRDVATGRGELRRVARGPVVTLTFDPDAPDRFWLVGYVPELIGAERHRYPPIEATRSALGGHTQVQPIPVPIDCLDGFTEASYARPERFLDQEVRRAQSAWAFVDPAVERRFVATLGADLASGAWDRRYGAWRSQPQFEGSLRLILGHPLSHDSRAAEVSQDPCRLQCDRLNDPSGRDDIVNQANRLPRVEGHGVEVTGHAWHWDHVVVAQVAAASAIGGHHLPLAGPTRGRRVPRRLPRIQRGVADRPVRGIRPSAVEAAGVHRVLRPSVDHPLAVHLMRGRLRSGQESGAQPPRLRTEGQHGGKGPPVPDATGGDDRHRPHRVHDGGHQRHGGDLTPDVAAGLPALGHDHVDAGVGRSARFLGAADGVQVQRTGSMDALGHSGRVAPERRDDLHALVQACGQQIVDREVQHEVHPEGPVGELPDPTDPVGGLLPGDPRQRKHPQSARGGHRSGQLRCGRRADRCLHDGQFDAQPVAQRRHQHPLLRHVSSLRCVPVPDPVRS